MLLLLLLINLLGCGKDNSPTMIEKEPEIEITKITSTETDIAIVVSTIENEQLVVLSEKDSEGNITKITGGSYTSPDSLTFTCWFDDNGLPAIAVYEGWTFSFSNYSNDLVDVSVTTPNDNIFIVEIEIDPEQLLQLQQLWPGKLSIDASEIAKAIRAVSAGVSLGCCIGSTAATLTGVGATIGVPGIIVCCVSGTLGTIAVITENDVAGDGALAVSALECAASPVIGCAGIALEAIAKEIEEAGEIRDGEGAVEIIGEVVE